MTVPDVIPLSWKIGATLALCGALWGGYAYWHHKVYQSGYKAAEAVGKENMRKANVDAELTLKTANDKVSLKQSALDEAIAKLSAKEKDYRDEQVKSTAYQRSLADGTVRMRILTTANQNCNAGQNQNAGVVGVGALSETLADVPARIAANLDRLRSNENEAITRLNACVESYETVRATVNAP